MVAVPVTPSGAVPTPAPTSAQPYNGPSSADGKYIAQPSAPPPQLYATPNATISILLPYNGGAPPPPSFEQQHNVQYQQGTNYPPAYPNNSPAPTPSAPPYQIGPNTSYPPQTNPQQPGSYQPPPSTNYPPTYTNPNNNNAPNYPPTQPQSNFPTPSPTYPPASGNYQTQNYPPTQPPSTFPQPCAPQAPSGHQQYQNPTNAPNTYQPGPTQQGPGTNYYQQPQANTYAAPPPAGGVWPPPPSY